jgi:hypothetical protein
MFATDPRSTWCSIMFDQIAAVLFFHESTTMSVVFLDILQNFVFPHMLAEDHGLIFQQDGAAAHFGAIVCTALDEQFPGQWIGWRWGD